MIQPILLLLLLAARSSPVFGTEISVLEGSSVTLVFRYPYEWNQMLYTTWSETLTRKWWSCGPDTIITTTITQENRYRVIAGVGMVNFTILDLQLADSGSYCCRAEIPKGLNNTSEFYSLRVVKGHTGCNRDLLDGLDFLRNNIENQPVAIQNASQCREECTNNYKCQYFTFIWNEAETGMCSLKASIGDLMNSTITMQHLIHATSGFSLKNCSGKVTYSTKKYSLILEKKNWTEAQEYCRQHYTNLSIIHTEQDWKAVQSSLNNFSGDVWIGLHRDKPDPDGKWKWSDGEDFMFLNWENNFGDHNVGHDCVLSISSHWQPVECAATRKYMCQRVHHGNGTTEKVYELMLNFKSQDEALKDCLKESKDLASILNQKEQEAFDEVAKQDHTWIGLKNSNSNKLWEWLNGEPFQQWERTTGGGNCVQLNSGRKWTPKDCSSQSEFLCYGYERPSNTTVDLTTPVTPETISPTSTGPPSSKMSTTTPTTTNGQSTTSPPTTTNGQSTTSPPTTTNGQSTTSPPTTTNGQSTTSPPTTANGQSTTSPPTTTNGQSTISLPTTNNGQSNTSHHTTTNGQSTTSHPTATTGQSTTPPTSTSSGQLTSSGPTSTDRKPTSSPSSTASPLHPDYLHYFNESKSWINALEFCERRGSKSNLVHITNQTIHADVTQLLANVELPCGGVWIGLERSVFEWSAPWLWTSGDVVKVVEYREWHSCFPLNPINYHCGKMVQVGKGELKWLDASCHQELPFICQDLH